MKYSTRSLACIIAVLLGTAAQAEIYEGKDAQGNTVFTDTPSPGTTKVDLPESNIADAVKPLPEEAPMPGDAPEASGIHEQGGNVVVVPDSRNEELERGLNADKPHEVLEAETPYEVGDVITPAERARREAAKEGIVVDPDGNQVRVEHQGHVGGRR